MYRMPVIIVEISGLFSIMTGVLWYPAYYTATGQNEKINSHSVTFYNLFVTIRRVGSAEK